MSDIFNGRIIFSIQSKERRWWAFQFPVLFQAKPFLCIVSGWPEFIPRQVMQPSNAVSTILRRRYF